jgi:hypothetical protein
MSDGLKWLTRDEARAEIRRIYSDAPAMVIGVLILSFVLVTPWMLVARVPLFWSLMAVPLALLYMIVYVGFWRVLEWYGLLRIRRGVSLNRNSATSPQTSPRD